VSTSFRNNCYLAIFLYTNSQLTVLRAYLSSSTKYPWAYEPSCASWVLSTQSSMSYALECPGTSLFDDQARKDFEPARLLVPESGYPYPQVRTAGTGHWGRQASEVGSQEPNLKRIVAARQSVGGWESLLPVLILYRFCGTFPSRLEFLFVRAGGTEKRKRQDSKQ
jgi:hypothetical protein